MTNRVVSSNEDKYSPKNPLYNVMMTDYEDNKNKSELSREYSEKDESLINTNVKNFVLENNKDNKPGLSPITKLGIISFVPDIDLSMKKLKDDIFSIENVGIYKPSSKVYDMPIKKYSFKKLPK